MDYRMKNNLEILNELKMHAPKLHQLKEETPVFDEERPDEGYFNNLQDLVLTQYKIESYTISDETVPSDYFNSLQNNVLNELKVADKKNRLTVWKKYAAVLVVVLISVFTVGYFLNYGTNRMQDDYQVNLNALEDGDLMIALDDYINKKVDLNMMIEHGVLDDFSNDEPSEEYELIDYMNINENEILESYQNKQ